MSDQILESAGERAISETSGRMSGRIQIIGRVSVALGGQINGHGRMSFGMPTTLKPLFPVNGIGIPLGH